MRNVPALRLGAQVFFCIGVLSFFELFRQDMRFFLLLAALITAAAIVAERISRKWMRFLLSLVPGLAFLVPLSHRMNILFGGLLLAYATVVVTFSFLHPGDESYRIKARFLIGGDFLILILSIILGMGGMSPFWLPVCSILLALLALRMQQAAGSMGFSWQTCSVGFLVAVLGVGIGTGLLIWALRADLASFFRSFGIGLASIFLLPFQLVLMVLRSVSCEGLPEESVSLEPSMEPSINDPGNPPAPIPGAEPLDPSTLGENIEIPWMEILTASIVILLLLAAIWFIRVGRFGVQRQSRIQQADGTIVKTGKVKRKTTSREDEDNRRKLCFLYGRYLGFLREKGVKFYPGITTEEITDASEKLLAKNDELLRSLYRRARYSAEPITDQDLAAAQVAFDQLVFEHSRRSGSGG